MSVLSNSFFQSPSKKNKANGQSTTPELSEAMKKRTERFGDVSDAAKASTMNVRR